MQKDTHGFSVLEVVVVLVIVGIIVAGGLLVAKARRSQSVTDLIPAIANDLANHYSNVATNHDAWKAENAISLPQKVSGYDYGVSSASAPTLSFSLNALPALAQSKVVTRYHFFKHTINPATDDASLVKEVDDYLQRSKFTSQGTTTSSITFSINETNVTDPVQTTTYVRGSDRCLISQNPSLNEISCFSITTTLPTIAEQDKPFIDAYLHTHPNSKTQNLTVGPLTIKSQQKGGVITASETPGYDIAEAVTIDNGFRFLSLFYAHQGQWHFVGGANDEFGFQCSDMRANPDARRALYDQVCYNGSQGQIRLDSTRHY